MGASSLLVSGSASCASNDPLCNPPIAPESGELSIQADPIPPVNMDQSNVVEVTGSCVDLGHKKNRILVEVFAGDLDESVDPYITNEITSNCYSSNPSPALTSSGLLSTEKCFWVTKGVGIIEDPGLPSQKEFPQCHNGQFGFAIKLGKILNDAGGPLGVNYLVRYKIRAEEAGVSESAWTRTTISRQLTPPKITSTVYDPLDHKCTLTSDISRFNPLLNYSLKRSFQLFGGGATITAPIVGYTNLTALDSEAYSYPDFNLVDGLTYNYSLSVTDTQFPYVSPVLTPAVSNTIACKTLTPQLYQNTTTPPGMGKCILGISNFNPTPGMRYEFQSGPNPGWTKSSVLTHGTVACGSGTGSPGAECSLTLPSNVKSYVAVRAYKDSNSDGIPNLPTEEVGEWSTEITCIPP